MPIKQMRFPSLEDWARAAADEIAARLNDDITQHGQTTLAVPGGRTARAVLPALRNAEIDWARVVVTLTDERWVAPTHADSNERQARALLGDEMNIVGLYTGEATPDEGLPTATQRLQALLPLRCVLLGMGEDGHIASLFPNAPTQDAADLQTACRQDHPRISLTPRTLRASRSIVLCISGAEKRRVLDQALSQMDPAAFPVAHILDHPDVTILSASSQPLHPAAAHHSPV